MEEQERLSNAMGSNEVAKSPTVEELRVQRKADKQLRQANKKARGGERTDRGTLFFRQS
jgi:hypothetical protein